MVRNLLFSAVAVAALGSSQANAGGCLEGAVAGAVAGHYAHHTLSGLLGGCLTGRVLHADYEKYKETHPGVSFEQFVKDQKDRVQGMMGGGGQ